MKWLQDAANSVKRNSFYMKRSLVRATLLHFPGRSSCCLWAPALIRPSGRAQDEDNLREALRFSAAMLGELRTSLLTPQKYFELYMQVFDELRHLEVGALCPAH